MNKPDDEPLPGPPGSLSSHLQSRDVNFRDLDLNLLVALDALLTERSVTRAAASLMRSQPALSMLLKRLRRQFGDELLVRVGNAYELTPLAEQLKPRLALVLADVERLFATRARFDAATSTRTFVVHCADYGQVVLGSAVAGLLAAAAPGVTWVCKSLTEAAVSNTADVLRSSDGFIMPHGMIGDFPHLNAFTDRWVLVTDRRCSRLGDSVTIDQLDALDWVLPFHYQDAQVPVVRQLQLLGVRLKAVVSVDGFIPLLWYVRGTERITVMQERLARRVAPESEYRIIEPPIDAVPIVEALWWHPAVEHDLGHVWFRSIVERAGRMIGQEG